MPSRKLSPRMVACLRDAKDGHLVQFPHYLPGGMLVWGKWIAGSPEWRCDTVNELAKASLLDRDLDAQTATITPAGLAALKEIDDAS